MTIGDDVLDAKDSGAKVTSAVGSEVGNLYGEGTSDVRGRCLRASMSNFSSSSVGAGSFDRQKKNHFGFFFAFIRGTASSSMFEDVLSFVGSAARRRLRRW